MAKHGKKFVKASQAVDANKTYGLSEACEMVKKAKFSKFDESVDMAVCLGVDPRHADQVVRGAIQLPHGTGKTIRVCVFAKGPKVAEAEEAGADVVGGAELAEKVEKGFLDFDKVVATPDMMAQVGKLGRVLGPRGLMPNPKVGTVTMDVKKAVEELKGGKIEFRVDKCGNLHAPVGRASFDGPKLADNVRALMGAIVRAKPSAAKGIYIKKMVISSTMGPGVKLDNSVLAKSE